MQCWGLLILHVLPCLCLVSMCCHLLVHLFFFACLFEIRCHLLHCVVLLLVPHRVATGGVGFLGVSNWYVLILLLVPHRVATGGVGFLGISNWYLLNYWLSPQVLPQFLPQLLGISGLWSVWTAAFGLAHQSFTAGSLRVSFLGSARCENY